MSDGSRPRARIIGTSAERRALDVQKVELGTEWFETDTSDVYKVHCTAGAPLPALLTNAWLLLGNTSTGGGAWTSFAGAGPHVVTAAMGSVRVTPGAGVDAVVDLPDVTAFANATDLAIVMVGGGVGASVVLVPAGGQTLGDVLAARFYEGGAVVLRANVAALTWEVVALAPGVPNGLDVYVATTGSDAAPGTAAAPLLTIDEAGRRAGAAGYVNYCRVNLAAGTYALAANATVTLPPARGGNSEPPVLLGAALDSGLGTRTVGASSAGAAPTFATVTDAVGGLTVNAWKGYFLQYTSGAQAGKQYVIEANSATVFTLCGTQTTPTNGDTFVVVSPGAVLRSANNVIGFTDSGAGALGLRMVQLDGQSGASSNLSVRGIKLYHSACWFKNFANIPCNYAASLFTMFSAQSTGVRVVFPSLAVLQTVGSNFVSAVANASLSTARGSNIDLQNSLVNGMSVAAQDGTFQAVLSTFQGASGVRAVQGADAQVAQCRFETVAGVAGDYATAAVVFDQGSAGLVQLVDISNCVGIAVSIAASVARVLSVTGSGNAGVPVSVLRGGRLVKSSGNAVTGATPGNDVQVGGNAASTAWATVNAGLVTDQAAVASQFCSASS